MSPALFVISAFKGVRATARALGRDPSAISKWKKPKENGGLGGEVPKSAMKEIILKAKELGLDITHKDLIEGREDNG